MRRSLLSEWCVVGGSALPPPRYRLRLVAVTSLSYLTFGIEGHKLTGGPLSVMMVGQLAPQVPTAVPCMPPGSDREVVSLHQEVRTFMWLARVGLWGVLPLPLWSGKSAIFVIGSDSCMHFLRGVGSDFNQRQLVLLLCSTCLSRPSTGRVLF